MTKLKNGKLTQKDFDRFSEIMKNAENYDKLGITTGVVFNKAKVIFKAMGNALSISGLTTKNASQMIEEKLQKAKEIVKKDRDSLPEEEQAKWDEAQKHIEHYTSLKETFEVYGDVSTSRMQKRWSWLFEFENNKKPILPKSTTNQTETVPRKTLSATLADQTVEEPNYQNVPTTKHQIEASEQTK